MNPLFTSLMGQVPQQDSMNQLRSNPSAMLRNAGFNVPDGIVNDPRATVMHLMQTGQISNPMMQRIMPMIQQMTGR